MNSSVSPLFHNDPLLVAIMARLGFSPLAVFYLTLLLVPGVLLAWASLTKTLRLKPTRGNPDGHGLCSPINAYLLLVPFLNYCIFDYYEAYGREIQALFTSHVLPGTFDEFSAVFSNPWAIGVTLFGYVAGLVLAILSVTWQWKWKKSTLTNWLCASGRPRAIAWYFNFTFFSVELAILFNWALRHLLIWWTLSGYIARSATVPLHPDKMFGLGQLSTMAFHSLVVITASTFLVAMWLVGARLTLRQESLFRNPGYVTTIVVLVLLGPIVVIAPLTSAHKRLETAKDGAQQEQAAQVVRLARTIQGLVSDDPLAEQKIKAYETQERIYQQIETAKTWPLSGSASGSLFFAFLNPLLLPLAVEAGKKMLDHRWFGAKASPDS